MRGRRLLRPTAVGFLLAALAIAIVPSASGAAEPRATGWWSRRVPLTGTVEGKSSSRAVRYTPSQELPTGPTVPVPTTEPGGGPVTTLPPPVPVPTIPDPPVTLPEDPGPGTPNPLVPDGGLWVANDVTGAVAISALRYRGDVGNAELTLRFAPGSTTVGKVVACPALSSFEPGPSGAWRDRPAHDCDRMALTGRLTSDQTGMQFSIPQSFLPFGERVLDIILLPDPASGDVFSLYFEAPDASSLEILEGQELPPPAPELPPLDPDALPEPAFDTGTGIGVLSPGVTDAPEAPPASDLSAEDASGPTDQGPVAPSPIADLLEPLTENRFARIVAVAILLSMGAGLWFFGGAPVREPRLLGALAGDAPVLIDQPSATARGIGRFRRARVGPPTRL